MNIARVVFPTAVASMVAATSTVVMDTEEGRDSKMTMVVRTSMAEMTMMIGEESMDMRGDGNQWWCLKLVGF